MRALAPIAAIVAAAAALGVEALRAQTYGPFDQVLTIGAVEFEGDISRSGSWIDGATRYRFADQPPSPGRPTVGHYWAPLALPEGALITRLCMWVYDGLDDTEVKVSVALAKLVNGGEIPALLELSPLQSRLAPGYHSYCEDLTLRVTRSYDVDGDAVPDPVAWYLRVDHNLQRGLGFGAVQVTWRRDVSPSAGGPELQRRSRVPSVLPVMSRRSRRLASPVDAGAGIGRIEVSMKSAALVICGSFFAGISALQARSSTAMAVPQSLRPRVSDSACRGGGVRAALRRRRLLSRVWRRLPP